ncbi:alpha/beta hydrolase fold protein [Tanacetum coccineum]
MQVKMMAQKKKKKQKKGAQDEASEYALVAANAVTLSAAYCSQFFSPGDLTLFTTRGSLVDQKCSQVVLYVLPIVTFCIHISTGTSRGSPMMILNGYVGRDTYRMKKDNDEKIYRRLDSCLVIPPPKGKKAKAIIKFLGGAFIGEVPEVTYGLVVLPVFILFPLFYLLGLLANEGYLIISVPYNVTFVHSQATRKVFKRFHSCLNSVLTFGLPSDGLLAVKLVDLPLYSVSHSNGALFQVLSGSYFSDKLPKHLLYLPLLTVKKTAPKGKAAKDPNKPKRLASSFFVFMKQFKEENPTINSIDAVDKAGGAKWKANKFHRHAYLEVLGTVDQVENSFDEDKDGGDENAGNEKDSGNMNDDGVENSFDGDNDGGDENDGNEKDGGNMNDDVGKTMGNNEWWKYLKVMH